MFEWLRRNKITLEIDLLVVLGIVLVVGGLTAFVLTRGGSDSPSQASAAQRQVMPGHGSVMPTDVRVADSAGTMRVAMGDYWFKPGSHRVRAGTYRFVAHNYGSIPHDIMLTPAKMMKFESPNQPADDGVGLDDMQPGMTKSMRVKLTPGRWVFFCSVSGHYAAGQRAVLDVVGPMPKGSNSGSSQSMMGQGMG